MQTTLFLTQPTFFVNHRFGIFFSAFEPADPVLKPLFQQPVDLPVFSAWGAVDFLKDKSESLHATLSTQGRGR